MRKLQKPYVLLNSILVILTVIVNGPSLLHRERRNDQIVFIGGYYWGERYGLY